MATARTLALVLAAVATGVAPAPAPAAPPPPERPVIDQYIEMIPTAEGPSSPRAEEERQPLPAAVGREIREQAGEDAGALTEIATSSRYGAPQRPQPAPEPQAPEPEPAEEPPAGDQYVAETLEPGDAATVPGESRLIVLLVAMAASVVAVAGYGLVRRRRS
jgi:hypothetical protein